MNSMKTFLALLRDSLWQSEENLPSELLRWDSAGLLSLAKQQTVYGLVIDSLIRHDVHIPQKMVFAAIGALEQIKRQSRIINDGVCKLHGLLTDNDTDYVIVKGQAVASYYPQPLIRQSGDIDYYCDDANFQKSQEIIKRQWVIDVDENDSDYHVHFNHEGVIYEGHFSLVCLYSKRKEDYWKRLLAEDSGATVTIDGRQTKTLSPTLHVLYIFLHLYHHLMSLGIGLRQFCDMAVMLHYAKAEIDMSALRRHLHELGMKKAWKACGSILVDDLGLQEDELGYSLAKRDRRYGKKIMNVVLYRGNMGHYNKRNGWSGWKHKLESIGIKLSHFVKFMPLAPGYSYGWLWHEVKRCI